MAGSIVAPLPACAPIFILTGLPYAMWFKIVMFITFPVACMAGIRYRRRSP